MTPQSVKVEFGALLIKAVRYADVPNEHGYLCDCLIELETFLTKHKKWCDTDSKLRDLITSLRTSIITTISTIEEGWKSESDTILSEVASMSVEELSQVEHEIEEAMRHKFSPEEEARIMQMVNRLIQRKNAIDYSKELIKHKSLVIDEPSGMN